MRPVQSDNSDKISRAGWRIVLLASLGGTLEFYDFVIFGVFGADLGRAIFPSDVPLVELLSSYGAFAAGYFARPIGGVVLSHFGDRYGRKNVFLLSLFVMSGATLAMGLVPTYAAWGVAASITMVLLRLLQGFCIGGELPGALTYVVETAPRQAPLVCGVVFACVTYGVAVATGVSVGVRTFLPAELVPEYGWRIAFILGGFGGIVSFIARRAMEESPEFVKMKALAARQPFREVLQSHRGPVLTGIGILALTGGFNGLYFSHMPGYLGRVLAYDARQAVVAATIAVVIHATMIFVAGWLARRIAPLTILRAGTVGLLVFGYPFYAALAAKPESPTALLVGIGLIAGLINGTYAVLLTDLFPTRIRFSGVALAFNIAFSTFSGTAPLVATALIGQTGSNVAPAIIVIVCGLLTLVASLFHPKYSGHVLHERVPGPGARGSAA
jgi:MFS transporter, MHS family, proline/betaine transporter